MIASWLIKPSNDAAIDACNGFKKMWLTDGVGMILLWFHQIVNTNHPLKIAIRSLYTGIVIVISWFDFHDHYQIAFCNWRSHTTHDPIKKITQSVFNAFAAFLDKSVHLWNGFGWYLFGLRTIDSTLGNNLFRLLVVSGRVPDFI